MKPSLFDADTSALDVESYQQYRRGVWGSNVGNRAKVIGARCGDVGSRAELPAISALSFRQYQRLRNWYNSADV